MQFRFEKPYDVNYPRDATGERAQSAWRNFTDVINEQLLDALVLPEDKHEEIKVAMMKMGQALDQERQAVDALTQTVRGIIKDLYGVDY